MSNSNKQSKGNLAVIIIAAVVLAGSLAFLAYYMIMQKRAADTNAELANRHTEVITQSESETSVTEAEITVTEAETVLEPLEIMESMKSFKDENPDTVGWITVGGTSINNVVVQTSDNDYYLNHDFYGRSSQPGTVFADYRCIVDDYGFRQSDNIILYGHNQANGEMFGTLQK